MDISAEVVPDKLSWRWGLGFCSFLRIVVEPRRRGSGSSLRRYKNEEVKHRGYWTRSCADGHGHRFLQFLEAVTALLAHVRHSADDVIGRGSYRFEFCPVRLEG